MKVIFYNIFKLPTLKRKELYRTCIPEDIGDNVRISLIHTHTFMCIYNAHTNIYNSCISKLL